MAALLTKLFGRKEKTRPTFLILGTQKGGTSSLHTYLAQHPQLFLSTPKELHFFSLFYKKGWNWYCEHFAKVGAQQKHLGESSPYYLFHPGVPTLVKKHLPNAKFIVLLRNPGDRAFSHFIMERNRDAEPEIDFFEAIKAEADRLKGTEEFLLKSPYNVSKAHQTFSYAARGLYAAQLKRWFEHLPKTQFLFLKSEDFFANPEQTLQKVYAFLEVDEVYPANLQPANTAEYAPLSSAQKEKLQPLFAADQHELEQLLGNEFVW